MKKTHHMVVNDGEREIWLTLKWNLFLFCCFRSVFLAFFDLFQHKRLRSFLLPSFLCHFRLMNQVSRAEERKFKLEIAMHQRMEFYLEHVPIAIYFVSTSLVSCNENGTEKDGWKNRNWRCFTSIEYWLNMRAVWTRYYVPYKWKKKHEKSLFRFHFWFFLASLELFVCFAL